MRRSILFVLIFTSILLTACGGGSADVANDRLLEAFDQGRTDIWVSGQAPVSQILGDEAFGGNFQRFSIRLSDDIQTTIRHSLDDSERIPVERGDLVTFQGLFDWNGAGGNIALTHSDPEQPGGGGWIEHKGIRYD